MPKINSSWIKKLSSQNKTPTAVVDREDLVFKKSNILFFIFILTWLCSLILFSPLGLAPDEAHYLLWSKQLDWSYYSKGPLIAYIIRASTLIFGDSIFGVRFPAALLGACLFTLIRREFQRGIEDSRTADVLSLSCISSLIIFQSSLVMTTDIFAGLFWMLAILSAKRALVDARFWLLYPSIISLGMLGKYTLAILIPIAFLYQFIFLKRLPQHSLRNLIVGCFLSLVFLFPVLYWNIQHDWVNFAHNSGHLVAKSNGFFIKFNYFLELVLSQLGLVGLVLGPYLTYLFYRSVKEKGILGHDNYVGFLIVSIGVFFVTVFLLSLTKRIYPNWPLPGYISAFLFLAYYAKDFTLNRFVKIIFISNIFLLFIAVNIYNGATFGLPPKILPTTKLRNWSILGDKVQQLVSENNSPVIAIDDYGILSQIIYNSSYENKAYQLVYQDRRMNQFDVWGGWKYDRDVDYKRDFLIILKDDQKIEVYANFFSSIKPIGEKLSFELGGKSYREFSFYLGSGFKPELVIPPQRR